MVRPVWLQFNVGVGINATGTTAVDVLAGHLDTLQQSERTVVAIKAQTCVFASTVNGVTPDSFVVHLGITTGPSTLVSSDFPDLGTDGIVNPGWMYRDHVSGVVGGDGTESRAGCIGITSLA